MIGTYNPIDKVIDRDLIAYDVRKCNWVDIYFKERKARAKKLIDDIKAIKLPSKERMAKELKEKPPYHMGLNESDKLFEIQRVLSGSCEENYIDYIVPYSEQEDIKFLANKYLDISDSDIFDNAFFKCGWFKNTERFAIQFTIWRWKLSEEGD